ncbi:MAG TPA: MBL fold metallo-hydrolase, partial [Methanothrix soehngenii]|nr:MBL fold metallo-hydrolase [Methanothrix soehngenii]
MTLVREIKPGVFSIGAIDWDRRLFDALIALPDGTSYNSYLVRGKNKIALIDAVDSTMADVLIENLNALGIKKIDYIIVQHAEQDHTGSLGRLVELYPDSVVAGSARCLELLVEFGLVDK